MKISFLLDGKVTEIDFNKSKYTPTTTVLEYLRSLSNKTGVKEGCAEGDCGACTITVVELANKDSNLTYRALNSCLLFLPSINGKQLITVENLGTSKDLHVIQQAMVETDASQCGFCTPGFVMSIFAQYKTNPQSSEEQIVDALTGNLCRCTGYRPIMDAARISFKADYKDQFSEKEGETIQLLKKMNENKETLKIETEEQKYFIPKTLTQLFELKKQLPNANIMSGSTDLALRVTKGKEIIKEIIDISQISDLKEFTETDTEFKIGSGVVLEDIRNEMENKLPALYRMLNVFGAKQIRNKATLGGNIGTASPIGDISMTLFAYKTKLVLANSKAERTVDLDKFIIGYRKTVMKSDEIIKTIIIPKPSEKEIIDAYKVSKRSHLDISTVSASFNLEKDKQGIVNKLLIVYGGMSAMTQHATKTEQFLIGKKWTEKNILEAQKILETEFTPLSDARSSAEARVIMCKNLLMKFFDTSC